MASFRRASNQAEWQRPPQRTPYSPLAYLPSGVLHSAPFLMPPGRPTAHPGESESGLPRRPMPPPPRRVLSQAQAALSLTGQAQVPLSYGSSLQSAVHQVSLGGEKMLTQEPHGPFTYSKGNKYAFCHLEAHRVHCHLQAAGHYRAVSHSPQQQQQQWLLPGQGQKQPNLPFQGHQAWVQAAYGQPYYSQQQHMAVPQQVAEHQPALQQPGMAPQMRHHSPASPRYAHAQPQPCQQPSVQHVTHQTASQRVFSTQKSSLNGNARPFVGSAKALASASAAADVYSGASGSDVSSSRTSPSTSSQLQGAAAGQILLPIIWLQAIVTNLCNTCTKTVE